MALKICPRLLRCDCGIENAKLAQLQPLFRYNDTDSMSGIRSFMYGKKRIESANRIVVGNSKTIGNSMLDIIL